MEILDGEEAGLVYDAAPHYGGIQRALEDTGLFAISRNGSRLVLQANGKPERVPAGGCQYERRRDKRKPPVLPAVFEF